MDFDTVYSESLLYLIAGGLLQFFFAVILAPFFYALVRRLSVKYSHSFFRDYFVFNIFLWLWGCLGNLVFMFLTYEKLYVSVDSLGDFFPFIVFGQWVLDQGFSEDFRGYLVGEATLSQLRLIWLAVAAPVWGLAWVSTVLTLRKFCRTQNQWRPIRGLGSPRSLRNEER